MAADEGMRSALPSSDEHEVFSVIQNCSNDLPTFNEYMHSLPIYMIVLIGICGLLALLVLVFYIEQIVFFFKHLHQWKPRDKAKWVLAIYPIVCTTSFVSLLVPRSSDMNDLVASVYLSICVQLFVRMLVGHYGGAGQMVRKLAGSQIKLASPPLCCICLCLPSPQVTSHRLQILQTMVLQFALISPLMGYLAAIFTVNGNYKGSSLLLSPATFINAVDMVSTLVALWGFAIVYQLSQMSLRHVNIRAKFLCLQLVILTSNLQRNIFRILVAATAIKCSPPLNADANGLRYHNMLLIVEMFVLSLVARHYYRDSVGREPLMEETLLRVDDLSSDDSNILQYPPGHIHREPNDMSVQNTGATNRDILEDVTHGIYGSAENHSPVPAVVVHHPETVSDIENYLQSSSDDEIPPDRALLNPLRDLDLASKG